MNLRSLTPLSGRDAPPETAIPEADSGLRRAAAKDDHLLQASAMHISCRGKLSGSLTFSLSGHLQRSQIWLDWWDAMLLHSQDQEHVHLVRQPACQWIVARCRLASLRFMSATHHSVIHTCWTGRTFTATDDEALTGTSKGTSDNIVLLHHTLVSAYNLASLRV